MNQQGPQLPIQDVIEEGLKALESANPSPSIPALLVSIGAPKLRSLGYYPAYPISDPEKKLYALLSQTTPHRSVHSLYNSWIRRLVSFEHAATCAKTQQ